MGCDIHLMTEYKITVNNENVWVNCDHWSYNPYFLEKEIGDQEKMLSLEEVYNERNYKLFYALAGVRGNYDFEKLSEPKGIPIDAHKVTKDEIDNWGEDGHSHSYFTFKELDDYYELSDSVAWNEFIGSIEKRLRDVLWIWGGRKLTDDEMNNFRIVFFFDN